MKSFALTALAAVGLLGGGCESSGSPSSRPPPAPTPTPRPAPAPDGPGAATADPAVHRGAALYRTHCALCHGPAGQGYAADNAPSLVNPTFLASVDESFFFRSIELGRPGTAMAGYGRDLGGPLDDKQINDIIAFLRRAAPPPATLAPAPTGGDVGRGLALYNATCRTCHGDTSVRGTAPHLANPVFLATAKDEFIAHAIRHGRPGTPMMPFPQLTDQQVADLLAAIRSWTPKDAGPDAGVKPPTPPVPAADQEVVLNPKGKPPTFTLREGRYVAADEVKKALDQKRRLVLLDARPPSDWAAMRIPGALSVPHYRHDALSRVPNDGTWVIAYCACPHHASGEVIDELRRRGYKNTAVLDEGILVWNQRKYPTEGHSAERLRGAAAPPPHVHNHPH